jgi:flagellar hook assembly protein FlgD
VTVDVRVDAGEGVDQSFDFALDRAHPNPFRNETTIRFSLATAGRADLVVYDVGGRRVRVLASGHRAAGRHTVKWDGRNDAGHFVTPGIYFYTVKASGLVATRQVALVR